MAYSIIQRGVDPAKVNAVLGGLNALEKAGLPIARQEATSSDAPATRQVAIARPTAQQRPRQEAISSPKEVQRIGAMDAKALLDKGEAMLYDVRVPEAYQAKHVVGAISFPEAEVEARFGTLPADKILILYCT